MITANEISRLIVMLKAAEARLPMSAYRFAMFDLRTARRMADAGCVDHARARVHRVGVDVSYYARRARAAA